MRLKKIGLGVLALLMTSSTFLISGCRHQYLVSTKSNLKETTILEENQNDRYTGIEEKLKQIDKLLDYYYLNDGDIDPQKMEDSIMKGYVEGLGEKYTTYYSAEEFKSLKESTTGVYEGIGVVVSQNRDTMILTVIQVFENGPGYAAGLLPGDMIYKIEGQVITGLDIDLVVKQMRGEEGTTLTMTIYRPDTDEYIDMSMNREHIEQPTVAYAMLEDKVGYIYISAFEEVTETQFAEAIEDLLKQGMEGLVIDLRYNPGGLVTTVCHMLDRILPAGKLLVYTEDKNGKREENISQNDEELNIPMAVVVNGNSASASEIFTAAMKDYEKGTIVGETTFGKGIVQVILPFPDGSALKVTTSKYYTPNGECIHEIGVVPNIEIKMDPDVEGDEQLNAAIEEVKKQMR